ncbi:MAG: chemotaxis protein CheW [Planctomycetes bacterium]|nr:chemotaxis protein CheW [Planctomycetota bacterium]
MPQAPAYVKGLTMVRGKVIPVIDARLRLGMAEIEETPETCIILVRSGTTEIGVVVDSVHEVVSLTEDQFEDMHEGFDMENLIGLAHVPSGLVTVLDIDQITRFGRA